MSTLRTSRRIVAAVLSAAALIAPICVGSASATGEGDSGVVVESTGDQSNAVTLPPVAVVGQSATSATTIELSIAASGQIDVAIRMDTTVAVTELSPDGGYVAVTTINHIELTNAPPGVDIASLGYESLPGAQFAQAFDANGKLISTELLNADTLSDAARQAAEGFTGNLQSAQFVYPDVPVGVGAKWSADLSVATEGFAIPTTYRYELTGIADGRYTIAVSYNSTFDTTIEGAVATGTVTGAGSVVGSVANPLDLSVTLDQTIDATSGGESISVVVGIDVVATAA